MKSLSQMLNESFSLNEKTSSIRSFIMFEKNPPEWAKDIKEKDVDGSTWSFMNLGFTKFKEYYGFPQNLNSYLIYTEISEILPKMCTKYLNEFIDLKNVPAFVMAGMIEDIFKNQYKNFKNTATREYANYLNNEINWVPQK